MSKVPKPVSGFPEWLPEARRVELQWIDIMRRTFESYGYASIEPASVEEVSVIQAKGDDADKEIYALRRLSGEQTADEPRLALHFDLTVPMARYVAQNFSALQFPFKRFQLQKAWRGERPQEGRYREFTQADIDVIDQGSVSFHFDAEMPRIVHKILQTIGIDNVHTNVNNRKIIQGYYEGLGIADPMKAIQIIDKIDKIGPSGVQQMLMSQMGLTEDVAQKCLQLAQIRSEDTGFIDQIRALGVSSALLDQGIEELKYVMDRLSDLPKGSVIANMSIARGLNYYTGTVYEGKLGDYPDFPTIFAGGRYENLVGTYLNRSLPGVGISIGLTRIFGKLLKEGRIKLGEKSPTHVVIINTPESDQNELMRKAELMRKNSVNVEVFHEPETKTSNQIRYATRKGIPYIMFASEGADEIKNLETGEQTAVDVASWQPDRHNTYQSRIEPSQRCSVLPLAVPGPK
ncbi:histidine--tRNA ligase [Bacteroides sp.]|uniref:histidine--tRNA ligase n=1 Tax=Bacteroides sp. TaxID=29523 RepID=UPI0026051327|nr:histidine--tRNA ligase [Bacteroides sp.]MDD3040656.1 histidine--tRNA ligase [Bacteroides sp.]